MTEARPSSPHQRLLEASKGERAPRGYLARLESAARLAEAEHRERVRRRKMTSLGLLGACAAAVTIFALTPRDLRVSPESPSARRADREARPSEPALAEPMGAERPSKKEPTHERARARGAAPKPEMKPAARAPLGDEVTALHAARTALVQGRGEEALQRLDTYDERFVSGELTREAALLRIEALSLVGRREEARARAREFLQRNPHNALSDRARKFLPPAGAPEEGERVQ